MLRDVIHKRPIVTTAWAVLNASVKIINMDMVMVTTRAPQNGTERGQGGMRTSEDVQELYGRRDPTEPWLRLFRGFESAHFFFK